jgi:hypothetical protein
LGTAAASFIQALMAMRSAGSGADTDDADRSMLLRRRQQIKSHGAKTPSKVTQGWIVMGPRHGTDWW